VSVTGPEGFLAAGVAAGIKASGARDLALVASSAGAVSAAATFTTNLAAAAPVELSRAHLRASGGRARAVILNSGCANAATGAAGAAAALETARVTAGALGADTPEILVCSTGLIGIALPIERLVGAVPSLTGSLGAAREDAGRAAEAIMTTDTHPKEVLVEGAGYSIGGMAKGAGMIAPNMATMLAVLTTDAAIEPGALHALLRDAVEETFNALIVDGCTSTNDTVILLASGRHGRVDESAFATTLTTACADLAYQLAEDAEGTTRVARVHVRAAASDEDARRAARAVATSLLVKTSLFGGDPYWGRIVSELGASGARFALDQVRVSYGPTLVCAGGIEISHDDKVVAEHLAGTEVEITCELGLGTGSASVLTTDLGHAYIDENMRTS
jgi:glutamate N-acetyltransferase / amino-acid N-acetyltransferase